MSESPLRYPGGKSKIVPAIEHLLKQSANTDKIFVEPFAGGASVSLGLLEKEIVPSILLNDKDPAIYSFWNAVLNETDRILSDIEDIPLTVEEWRKQKQILKDSTIVPCYELGFAAFYLNRTNRSGILKAGIIGGLNQNGTYKMSARFNRKTLCEKIEKIANKKNRIQLYNLDFENLFIKLSQEDSFLYLDPPYYEKGSQLYLDYFTSEDHIRLHDLLSKMNCDWLLSYDNCPDINRLYLNYERIPYTFSYSINMARKETELFIFSNKNLKKSFLKE